MSKKAESIVLLDEDRELLERFKRGQKAEKRLMFRAFIILARSSGKMVKDICL